VCALPVLYLYMVRSALLLVVLFLELQLPDTWSMLPITLLNGGIVEHDNVHGPCLYNTYFCA
jgi:hypothetical protein